MSPERRNIEIPEDYPPPEKWRWISRFEADASSIISDSRHQNWMKKHQESHLSREILLCLSGEHVYGFRGKIWRIEPGTVLMVDRLDTHDICYPSFHPPCRDLWIHLMRPNFFAANEAIVNQQKRGNIDKGKSRIQGLEDQESYQIPNMRPFSESVDLAWNYCDKSSSAYNLCQLRATVTALLLEVLLRGKKPCSTPEKVAHHQLVVDEIRTYVKAHLGANLSLNNLAKMAGYDAIYFHRLFTRFTGEPLHKFINAERLSEAQRLLIEGQKMIIIAKALGFANASNFCRFFRKETQKTPSEWLEDGQRKR